MARYIDEKDVYKLIEPSGVARVHCSQIDELPRADVVPKSELVREIFEEIEKKVKASLTIHLEEINKEHIKDTPLYDRHSGIIFVMQGMDDFIAELKKKYTEEK